MYIYNVTINVDPSIHNAWLEWMNQIHIPQMLGTRKFSSARMCRVLVEEETGGFTYAVQYQTQEQEATRSLLQGGRSQNASGWIRSVWGGICRLSHRT